MSIYLIVARYSHDEFYDIYGKGIYTSEKDAKKDWKAELKSFLMMGPDDLYSFSLVKLNLTAAEVKCLQDHIDKLRDEKNDMYSYDEKFTSFMAQHIDMFENAIYGPEGCDAVFEMQEAAENAGEDIFDDDKVFDKYFNKYYKQNY